MADDFDDFIAELDNASLQSSVLSLSKYLELDGGADSADKGRIDKLLDSLNDKQLEDLIDLDQLEQLERDLNADGELALTTSSSDDADISPPNKMPRKECPSPKKSDTKQEKRGQLKTEELFCVCRKPHGNRFMICCDGCEEWFHGDCVGITTERGRQMEKAGEDYTCPKCSRAKEKNRLLDSEGPSPSRYNESKSYSEQSKSTAHIPSSLREKAKSLKVATVMPTKHVSSDSRSYSRSYDSYDQGDRSSSKCVAEGCTEYAMKNSPYCSNKCVLRFAQYNMKSDMNKPAKPATKVERKEIERHFPDLDERKLSQPNPTRLNARKHLKTFLTQRSQEASDLLVTDDEIVKIAQNIEMSLFKYFTDTGTRYKSKFKAIIFNIKDAKNDNLYRNILSGTLSSEKLVRMSTDEMSMRITKQQEQRATQAAAASGQSTPNTTNILNMLGDTTTQHGSHVFDVKCRLCTGKAVKKREPSPKPTEITNHPMSPNRLAISAKPFKDPLGLNPALWKGYITMTSLTKFATSGYHVFGSHESLLTTLPDTLHVKGRIATNTVWAYVDRLRGSNLKELVILKFESTPGEEVTGYSNLFHYLCSRSRCGVIGNFTHPVRDMYLVPLSAEGAMPPQLRLLGVSSIPKKNRTNLILGLIVMTKTGSKRSRDTPFEALPTDDTEPPPPSSDSTMDHLATFPTDIQPPFDMMFSGGESSSAYQGDERRGGDEEERRRRESEEDHPP